MRLKKSLGKTFLYLLLEIGALGGVPMRPDEIAQLMQVMDRVVVVVAREGIGDDDDPSEDVVTPAV